MAESTLSLTNVELEAEVGFFLGWGRGASFDETAWTDRKQKSITDCVKSGIRMFYFPSPLPGDDASYDWSFMRPTKQIKLLAGASSQELPDDYGGLEGDVRLVQSNRYALPIKQTNEQIISQRYFAYPTMTGQPEMCAIRTGSTTGPTKGQRSTLLLFPIADQDYTLEFQYYFLPDSLSVSFPYALGGTTHSETIKAAVKAAAELHQDNEQGPMWALFMDRMKASISLDRRNKAQTLGYNSDPGYNRGMRQYGQRYYDQSQPITYGGVNPG